MNVFLINGSPKGSRSNTYQLSRAFLEGLGQVDLRECCVSQMDIRGCLGCFACWNKTPGKCVHSDDMAEVMENMLWADVILWSFPLYYFSVPGGLKNLMDRQLPMVLPFMSADTESGGHPGRYDMSGKRHVVISTCGFYTARGNYDGVTAIFDHLCGKGNYTAIFCGQGELFRVKELSDRTGEYLSHVRTAGREFAAGGITSGTREKLEQLLFSRQVFEAMADASWGIEKTGQPSDETLVFTKQMAALYNPAAWPGKDLVLEMYYTDLDKRYQIILGKEGSSVLTENFRAYTTRIETPFTVWKAIASGEITGQEALAQQRYRVKGDFNLMLRWDDYFGTKSRQQSSTKDARPTNMGNLLLPWIAFWVAAPALGGNWGAVAALAAMVLGTVLLSGSRRTGYDHLSHLIISGMSLMLYAGIKETVLVPVSYLLFGLMWTASCLKKVPLTAHYSMNDYGGEEAMENPLFVKTNRILTACWGVLYLLSAVWTCFLMGTSLEPYTGAINSVVPAFMGLFTVWFQKWYPAKVARG